MWRSAAALASAIDREHLIREVLLQPWRTPARGLIPPGIPGYQGAASVAGYPYNPEVARRYLAEAGYGSDKPIPPVELWYNRAGNNQALFGAIGDMLEAVGIPVRLVGADWDTYQGMLDACARPNRADAPRSPAECGYGMYGLGWALEYADAASLLETVFGPASPLQYMGWRSKAYTDSLAAARREGDEGRRAEVYREAERLLLTDVAVVPLLHYDRTLLVKAGLRFEYPPLGVPDLQFWEME